ncbi:MAG: hypothetical protein O3C10_07090 [Chloroflexi bacterium]|nr:hypothetical protein [Chloroflexota bacterium]
MATKNSETKSGRKAASKAKPASRAAAAPKSAAKSKIAAETVVAAAEREVAAAPITEELAVADESSECKHVWLIEPPNGPTSDGSCTVCGDKREFRNSYEYTPSWTARSGKAAPPNANAAKAGPAKAAASENKVKADEVK